MALETKDSLVRRHSATIVDYLDKGSSRILDNYCNLVSSGIDSILHELLHHGCRSLNDLSRSDHVCDVAW